MKYNTAHFEISPFDETVNTQAAKKPRWQEPPQSEDNCDVEKMEVTAKTTVGVLHELSVGLRVGKLRSKRNNPYIRVLSCFDVAFLLVLRSCLFLLVVVCGYVLRCCCCCWSCVVVSPCSVSLFLVFFLFVLVFLIRHFIVYIRDVSWCLS